MTTVLPRPDIESSIWIARLPEDIWKYVYDISNDTQWRDGVNSAKWISDPPHGVGSTGLHIIEGIGDWPWKATAFEEPRILAWEVTGGRFEGSHGAYRIEPEGNGSRFTLETRMKRSIIISFLMLFLKGRLKRQNAIDLEKLKAILEA
jgi:hypothetical protein